MSKRHTTHCPEEFKSSSAKLAHESSQPVSQTARDLGIHPTKYAWIKLHKAHFAINLMCSMLNVSHSGYCSWLHAQLSPRQVESQKLSEKVKEIFIENRCNYGAEREIKPFVIARNNFIFAQSMAGAKVLCMHFSLVRTALLHGLDPYHYYVHILKQLPHCKSVEDYEKLLPWHVTLEK